MSNDKLAQYAERLEQLMPRALVVLFSTQDDPLQDLPVGLLRLMRILYERSACPSEVARLLHLTPAAVTHQLNRLEARNLVTIEQSPIDRRMKILSLSTEGRDLMVKRSQARAARALKVLSQVPEVDAKRLIEDLERCIDSGLVGRTR